MVREKNFCVLHKDDTPVEIAKKFLSAEGYISKGGYEIVFFKGDFFVYEKTHYKKMLREALQMDVLGFLQEHSAVAGKTTAHHSKNILLNIAALVKIPHDTDAPCFLKRMNDGSRLIGMRNGIFDLDRFMKGKTPLLPHTCEFFSFNSLPFEYDPKANCPTWRRFIKEVLPDKALADLLQEWIGYNLIYDTSLHKFVLLVGAGANGKSVVCTVMREVIGRENISAVALEQFSPTRTFPLHAMVGKIANIVEEIGDVDKVAEDILKNIVAGGEMTIEQKGRDPSLVKFKSKLTFATNVVPRLRDRSDGIWRRVIFVPFTVQTLDPKRQNKNYVDGSWWVASGEMQGIMNWALDGLVRLTRRGFFNVPSASLEMKEEYKSEANPAASFMLDNYEVNVGGNLCSDKLYTAYSRSIRSQGGAPLGKSMFTREVKNIFPSAKLSKNPRVTSGNRGNEARSVRARVWENIREKQ